MKFFAYSSQFIDNTKPRGMNRLKEKEFLSQLMGKLYKIKSNF